MRLSDLWQSPEIPVPPVVEGQTRLDLPLRPPGRESFPIWEGVNLTATQPTVVRAMASGTILCYQPLTLLHVGNLLTRYAGVEGSTHLPAARVTCAQPLGQLASGATLRFELGLSLCAPQADSMHFMPLEAREVLLPNFTPAANVWRGSVPLEMIPLFLRRALVAVEDRRFYNHAGIDVARMGKALLNNLRQRQIMEGASTITQQAARSALHITQRTWFRKLIEIPIALALERFHNKDKILELYFNSIYWGRGATNVASAAIDFFGKNVWELNLKECALLAALPNHPLRWEVTEGEVQRLERKAEIVLRVMHEQGVVDDYIFSLAQAQPHHLLQ